MSGGSEQGHPPQLATAQNLACALLRNFYAPTLGLLFLALPASVSSAETLTSALERALAYNPKLKAQRINETLADEKIVQARAGYLPKVRITADASREYNSGRTFSPIDGAIYDYRYKTVPKKAGVELTQTLFDGMRTPNLILQATALSEGAYFSSSSVVQATLFDAAQAYMDVLRDSALQNIEVKNFAFLKHQAGLMAKRHAFGDVTIGDVSQVKTREEEAQYRVATATAALEASTATYRQIVGAKPDFLTPPRYVQHLVPKSLDAALATAFEKNPLLATARATSKAAEIEVSIAKADYLPTISVSASASRGSDGFAPGNRQLGASIKGQISIPLYDGGITSSQLRQTRATVRQRLLETDAAGAAVQRAVVANWGRYQSAKSQIKTATFQVRASQISLAGDLAQIQFGNKTLLEALNAQREALNSEINLASAKHDEVVAAFAIAQAMGTLTISEYGSETSAARVNEAAHRPPKALVLRSVPLPRTTSEITITPPCREECLDKGMKWGLRQGTQTEAADAWQIKRTTVADGL